MRAITRRAFGLAAFAAASFAAAAPAVRDLPGARGQPAQPARGRHRDRQDQEWLHHFMLIVCLVIFIAVFGVMFYSIFKHRKSLGARAATSTRARRSRSPGRSCRSSSSS
jgi:cytochrome c oxidase subunit 2